MPRPKSVETAMRAAFNRLKNAEPKVLPKGTPVTLSNVAKEAGMTPSSLRKERYPNLHHQIITYVEIHERKLKQTKKAKKRESDRDLIKRLKLENEKLINIVLALENSNEELLRENARLKQFSVVYLK